VTPDERFRQILLAGFLVLVGIGAFHRLSARTGEKLDRMQEGLFILVALRLVALAGMIALVLYFLDPAKLSFSALPLPDWVRWAGVFTGGITLWLLFWTLRALGKNLTDTVVTRRQHTLVTTGPYRWVRHPFYVCAGLVTAAVSMVSANALFLATGSLIMLLLAFRTRIEEANLLKRFGDDYRKYMNRTGRFIPRF
jgi:protein-S-isoprenylcysteine O-methyltransferase Ste14